MVQVALLLALVAFFTLASGWRLLSYRFPHPSDLIALSVIYYTFPLAMIAVVLGDDGGLVFLHAAAADYDVAVQSIAYGVLAIGCLSAGRLLAKTFQGVAQLQFALRPADNLKSQVLVVALLGLLVFGITLYGPGTFFAGYNVASTAATGELGNALIYESISFIGLTAGYLFLAARGSSVRFRFKLLALAFGLLLTMAVLRGKRLEVVSAFLPLGVLIFGTHPMFRGAGTRLVAILVGSVLISLLASFRLGTAPTIATVLFNLLSEGFFAGHSLPGVLDRLNLGQINYEHGARIALGFLAFIPRFIWPNKDDVVYAGTDALEGVSPLGATNILAEVVLQGGAVAVVLWYGSLGFLCERIHRAQDNFDDVLASGRVSAAMLMYLLVISTFIPHFRDGIIPSIKILFQSMLFLFALAGLRWTVPINWRAVVVRRPRSIQRA